MRIFRFMLICYGITMGIIALGFLSQDITPGVEFFGKISCASFVIAGIVTLLIIRRDKKSK